MRIALLSVSPLAAPDRAVPALPRFLGMAGALARAGHDVVTLAPGRFESPEGAITLRELRAPVTAREIDWHFSHVQPDLVIEFLVPGCSDGVQAAHEAGVPLVYDVCPAALHHSSSAEALVFSATAASLGLSAGAIVSSAADEARLREFAGPMLPVEVVPDGVGPEFFLSPSSQRMAELEGRLSIRADEWRVGLAGPVTRDSQVLDLVQAIGAMPAGRRTRLVLIGDGPARNEVLRAACESSVPVTLCGRVPHHDLPGHLQLCDVVVALSEGAEPSMLQAMAAGRALVTPSAPAMQRIARDGREACAVPPADIPALSRALRGLLDDEPARARMGAAGRRRAEEQFTWDSQVARLVEFAGGLAARSRAV